jgi:hypothetical protein
MMSLAQTLTLFTENVVGGTISAPDNYQEWDTLGWAGHREELLSLWADIKPRLKRDLDKVAYIDEHLALAIESFDRGEREPGQSLMVKIYNLLNLNQLR